MVYFILNPTAGNGKALVAIPFIRKEMESRNMAYKILKTKEPGAAIRLAKRAAKQKENHAEAIIAVGGDGTLQETAQGIIEAKLAPDAAVPLGILPLGRGNDFVNGVLESGKKRAEASVKQTVEKFLPYTIDNISSAKFIDAADVNGTIFINMGSIGLDCVVAENVQKKRRLGRFAYAVALLQIMLSYRGRRLTMEIDKERIDGNFTLMAIANGRQYGGGFPIAPEADPTDAALTVCLIDAMPTRRLFFFLPKVVLGRHKGYKEVRFINCKEIILRNTEELKTNLDGNIFTYYDDVSVRVMPQAIKVIGLKS